MNIFLVSCLFAQKTEVILSVDPTTADVGEVFTITVKSNVQGEVEIDNLPSAFVQGYDIMNGMEQEMDHNTGKVITWYFLSQTGVIGKKGKYTIGPAYVKKGNKSYKSNKVVITIGEKTLMSSGDVTAQQLKDPAFGIIQTNKKTIYEGEPILLSAKIYSQFEPTHLDSYLPYEMKGALDKHTIGNPGRIVVEQENYKGQRLYTFEYDKNVVFPTGTGSFKIRPFTMNLHQRYKRFLMTSSHAVVEIIPLPANPPKDFIGGVGNFRIERTVEGANLKQGDVFKMVITISGAGNLQNTLEPTPILPKGYIIYGDPIVTENISYGSNGAEGEIQYEYNIQVSKSGDLTLPATTISYFDLEQEKYVTLSTSEIGIKVEHDASYNVTEIENTNSTSLTELSEIPKLRHSNEEAHVNSFYGTSIFWIGVSTPLVASLLFLFILKRREQSADVIEVKQKIKRKDQQISSGLTKLKSLLHAENENEFFAGIEHVLKKAFEVEMKRDEDRLLNKHEIYAYLDLTHRNDLSEKVKSLFSKCDQYRYGFASTEASKTQLFDELNVILKELKS